MGWRAGALLLSAAACGGSRTAPQAADPPPPAAARVAPPEASVPPAASSEPPAPAASSEPPPAASSEPPPAASSEPAPAPTEPARTLPAPRRAERCPKGAKNGSSCGAAAARGECYAGYCVERAHCLANCVWAARARRCYDVAPGDVACALFGIEAEKCAKAVCSR